MELIQRAFDCADCKRLLKKPVTLSCGATVCLRHVEQLENGVFQCKSCERDHRIEKSCINVNRAFELLINANLKNVHDDYDDSFDSISQLERMLLEMERLTAEPCTFINYSIEKLRSKTDSIREHYKSMIDEWANNTLLKLDEYEQQCETNAQSADFKTKLTQTVSNMDEIRAKLADWKKKDYGSNKHDWNTTQAECAKYLLSLTTDLFEFKNQLLRNKMNLCKLNNDRRIDHNQNVDVNYYNE